MSNLLVNIVVIGMLAFTAALALYAYLSARKRKSASQSAEKAFENWLTAQNFSPDHLSCFAGTGIAIKDQGHRLALQSKASIKSFSLHDITALKAYQTTANSRPLGAAPGVVEIKEFQLFNIEISIRNLPEPIRILLQDEAQMQQWNERLSAYANI